MDNVDSDNEKEIDNLINNSDPQFIADEEIKPADNTPGISLITPEANIHMIGENKE